MTVCGVLPGSVVTSLGRVTHFQGNIDQTCFDWSYSQLAGLRPSNPDSNTPTRGSCSRAGDTILPIAGETIL